MTTCAWCDRPAWTEVEVEPAGIRVHRGQQQFKMSRRLPACADHAEPKPREPERRHRGPIDGQVDIFDLLGGEAA